MYVFIEPFNFSFLGVTGWGIARVQPLQDPREPSGKMVSAKRMIYVHFQGKLFNITVIQSMPQPVMLKKLKLISSMKTYKTF